MENMGPTRANYTNAIYANTYTGGQANGSGLYANGNHEYANGSSGYANGKNVSHVVWYRWDFPRGFWKMKGPVYPVGFGPRSKFPKSFV